MFIPLWNGKAAGMTDTPPPTERRSWQFSLPDAVVLCVLIPTVAVELCLIASDQGWLGIPRLRSLAYQYGAFWAGLLDNWRPNYQGQPVAMFVTYSFLHADLKHLLGNMVTLVFLAGLVMPWLGRRGFLLLYAVSAIGGAIAFALIGGITVPMVGASGALFGLAGAWKWDDWQNRRETGRSLLPVFRDLLLLVALNVLIWWLQNGALAWEAHLGGFVSGWLLAPHVARRRAEPADP